MKIEPQPPTDDPCPPTCVRAGAAPAHVPSAPRDAIRLTVDHLLSRVAEEEDIVDEGEQVHRARLDAYGDDDGQGEEVSLMRRILAGARCACAAWRCCTRW